MVPIGGTLSIRREKPAFDQLKIERRVQINLAPRREFSLSPSAHEEPFCLTLVAALLRRPQDQRRHRFPPLPGLLVKLRLRFLKINPDRLLNAHPSPTLRL